MIRLINDNKLKVQYAGKGEAIIGLSFNEDSMPGLEDLIVLAHELDRAGSEEDVRYRLLLGDTVSAMEVLPGVTKRELVDAAFTTFGEKNVYQRLRKYMHVARAFPVLTLSSAHNVRRRTDVTFSVLQELAPRWVPDDLRQEILDDAVVGHVTIKGIRQRLKAFRPIAASQEVNAAERLSSQKRHDGDEAHWEGGTQEDDSIRIPDLIPHFQIPLSLEPVLRALDKRARSEKAVNLLFVGEPGAGKTSLPQQFAARTKRSFFCFSCGTVREVSDFWGSRQAQDGRTFFIPSTLVRALTLGNAVVVFDEINRLPAYLLNPILGLLDDRRETETPGGLSVRIGEGTILVGTANIGDGFAGTFRMDRALADRFQGSTISVPALTAATMKAVLLGRTGCTEGQADTLLRITARINAAGLSFTVGTRVLLQAGHWLKAGLDFRNTCELAFLNGGTPVEATDRETLETILDGLIAD